MDLSTSLHVCEDASQTFAMPDLLTQAGYVPTGIVSDSTISSVVEAKWLGVPTLQGSEFLKINASAVSNQSGDFIVSMTMLDVGTTSTNINLDVNVIIDPVNDAPFASNPNVFLDSSLSYIIKESDFGFSDASDNPSNAFKSVVVKSLPAIGQIEFDGVAVEANAEISISDIRAGKLIYKNESASNGVAAFDFQVRDDGGNEGCDANDLSNLHTFTLTPIIPPTLPPVPVPILADVSVAILGVALMAAAARFFLGRWKVR